MQNERPNVSVVMSVYDKPPDVRKTIDSVLEQSGINLELLIIDDGASQDVVDVLAEYDTNPSIQIIRQNNQGLTKALIKGCSLAKHDYIARIDSGDVMLANRLSQQAAVLTQYPNVGIVSSWVNIVTDEGYDLYQLKHSTEELRDGLLSNTAKCFKSPFHASVMFRKSTYLQVGGYRSEFYFTQDCDLWARMIESSDVYNIDETLTHGLFSASGISGDYANEQKNLKKLVIAARQCRQQGLNEESVLQQASTIQKTAKVHSEDGFNGLYFIAKCLHDKKSVHAEEYWQRVLQVNSLSLRAWFFYAISKFYSYGNKATS